MMDKDKDDELMLFMNADAHREKIHRSENHSVQDSPPPKEITTPKKKRTKHPFEKKLEKNSYWIIPLICILIALSFSTHLRMTPAHLPIVDQWAEADVLKFQQNNIAQAINKQYAHLPPVQRERLMEREYQKLLQKYYFYKIK